MGKQPHDFIPVKYTNSSEDNVFGSIMNVMIGALFIAFFY